MNKRRVASFVTKYLGNPVVKLLAGRVPPVALLETTGRKSGLPRRNPVGNGLKGDTFWIVAEHGARADYVKNMRANPHVRVFVNRQWRTGTAHLMPDDDARARQRELPKLNGFFVRLMGSDLLTIRIDLDSL